ncbi:serine hydrolase [Streptomyces sp. NPDC029216]|uniref:D-alanyl-D-alanine carboxypeptidase n=1 Tax=Streptomyces sp. NPDC029216 TaxID=3154701 RepID=UPI0033CDA133
MKAETVAGGGTGALAGRERADAEAESSPGTATENQPTPADTPRATPPARDPSTTARPTPGAGANTPAGERTLPAEADAEASDEADPAAAHTTAAGHTPPDGEPRTPRTDTPDAETPDEPEPTDADAAAGDTLPAGEPRAVEADAEVADETVDAEATAGGHTSAYEEPRTPQTGTSDADAPGKPEPADAGSATAGHTPTDDGPRSAQTETSDAEAADADVTAGGHTPAEEESRASQADAPSREGTGAPQPTDADADPAGRIPTDGEPQVPQADSPDEETPGGRGPVEAGAAGAEGTDESGQDEANAAAKVRADDRQASHASEGASEAEEPEDGEARAAQDGAPKTGAAPRTAAPDKAAPDKAAPDDATPDEAAPTKAAPDDATPDKPAPAPSPSWAKRGQEPEDGDAVAGPKGAAVSQSPGPGARSDGGERGGREEAGDGREAAVRRPSWAEGEQVGIPAAGDEPEGADGRQAAAESPDEAPAEADAPEAAEPAGSRKGPGARAAAQPHDPERTSEFVALKDLDAAGPKATPKPTPKPKPEAAPAAAPEPAVLEPTRETPRPPLELLAELTNTAAPPETPRRTLVRRVKVWTPIVLLLGAAVAGAQMLRPLPAPQLVAAQDSVTLDGTTTLPWPAKGQAAVRIPGSGDIGTFGEQKPVPTASVAKVMTAYVILKNHPLRAAEQGPRIEIDAQAAAESTAEHESRIQNLTAGKKFSELDLLKMMMLPSANNIARLLARWDGGNEAAFVAKMNAAAQELGMRDTTYTDPSGLNSSTVSTAVDQLKLAEAAMRDETFRAIVKLPVDRIEGLSDPIRNSNSLLTVKGLGNQGIKTGSSTPAGGTLVWAAEKQVGGETPLILGALMDQHAPPPDKDALDSLDLVLNNSGKVIEAVRKAVAATPVIHKGQTVGYVSDGFGGRTPLVATKDLSVIGVPGQRLRLALGTTPGKSVPHEAAAGTEVGVLTVGDGAGAKTVPVAVGTRLGAPSFGARVTRTS